MHEPILPRLNPNVTIQSHDEPGIQKVVINSKNADQRKVKKKVNYLQNYRKYMEAN